MKRVSVILIDWNVRESFHAIDYLNKQTIPRSNYEIIWVEYYNHRPIPIQDHVSQGNIDKWIVLNKTGMYFKHLMYNEGVVASEGEIIVIPDSDAMFSSTFIESIITTFDGHMNENIVLYLEEIRSINKRFYPFKCVSWDEVMAAPGLVNWDRVAKKPHGLITTYDAIHFRNYGACFCARRKSIIESGGFDEHTVYHCFLCGPYEVGWRMVNNSYREIWHQGEWLLHLWHPWVRANVDVMGVSDGHGINSAALEIRKTGRVTPLVENEKIMNLRTGGKADVAIKAQPEKPGTVNWQKIESRKARIRDNLYKFKSLVKCLSARVMVNRVLIVTEDGNEGLPYWTIQLPGLVSRIQIFNYTALYHAFGHQKMSERLLEKCMKFKPELIIFVPLQNTAEQSIRNSVEPSKEIISRIEKELGIKVYVHNFNANKYEQYNEGFSLGNHAGIKNSLSEFDKNADNVKTIRGYPAVYPLDFYYRNMERDIDVCFWGSVPINSKREEYISFLRDNGINVCTREYRMPAKLYAQILNRSKISLSLGHDREEKELLRKRSFQIIACKSLLLEDSTVETKKLFDVGKDFVIFRNKEDLLERIRYYLEHEEERKSITNSGYDKVTNIYNSKNMWVEIFQYLEFKDKGLWSVVLKTVYLFFESSKEPLKHVISKMLPLEGRTLIKSLAGRLHIELEE